MRRPPASAPRQSPVPVAAFKWAMRPVLSPGLDASYTKFEADRLNPAQMNPERTCASIRYRGLLPASQSAGTNTTSLEVTLMIFILPVLSACLPHRFIDR